MMRFPEEYLLFKKEKNTRTHKKTRLTQPKETKRNAEMSSYYIHAGRTIEESPMREGSLYLYDKYVLLFFRPLFSFDQSQAFIFSKHENAHVCTPIRRVLSARHTRTLHREGWYDFFANATSITKDGFCDDETIGMKHVAVRDAGRESTFKPSKSNMFPRPKNWKPSKSNTQKEHSK